MRILFPTDFSRQSIRAFSWAVKLAKQLGASITLMNVYELGILSVPTETLMEGSAEIAKNRLQQLYDFVADFGDHSSALPIGDLNINYVVRKGNTHAEITQYAQEGEYSYIVMGTCGAGSKTWKKMGTVSSKVVAEANTPVFVVPIEAGIKAIQLIGYADDFAASDEELLDLLHNFSQRLDAKVKVFHFVEPQDLYDAERRENYAMIQFNTKKYENFSVDIVRQPDSIFDALETYTNEQGLDVLVLCAREENDREHPFERSLISKVVLELEVPVLVFPRIMDLEPDSITKNLKHETDNGTR